MLQMTHIQKIYRTELVETHALRELIVHSQEVIPQAAQLSGSEPLAAFV